MLSTLTITISLTLLLSRFCSMSRTYFNLQLNQKPYFFNLFLLVFLTFSIHSVQAAKELKFNCGGYALNGFQADPIALLSGDDNIYDYEGESPPPEGLQIGLSHRWGSNKGFAYDFTTGDGEYNIELTFAEIYPAAQSPGRRQFDIFVEDELQIKNLDVFTIVGSNVEYTEKINKAKVSDGALTIAFRKGSVENPMVAAIVITASNGSEISLTPYTSTDGPSEKPSAAGGWDHQAHAVAGGPYKGTDYNGNGVTDLFIDGTRSHSHYSNPETGESGFVKTYQWILKDDISNPVISTSEKFNFEFAVGKTTLQLTVEDQTGDSATAETDVTVLPVTASGAYCYYYNSTSSLPKDVNRDPRPDEGHSTNVINFFEDTFVYGKLRKDDGSPNAWAVRCVTDFQSVNTTQYKFSLRYRGTGAELYVNQGKKVAGGDSTIDGDDDGLKTISATVTVSDATVSTQVIYYSGEVEDPQLALLVDSKVVPAISLSYKTAYVLPCISSISSNQMQPQGGSQLQIVGTGFFNNISVSIGNVRNVGRTLISSTLIQIPSVPSMQDATGVSTNEAVGRDIEAVVAVSNNAGSSNALRISYTSNARKGIAWEQTVLKSDSPGNPLYILKQITSIKIGPDSNYYFGAYGGFVSRLEIGKDLVVKSKCDSRKLQTGRVIIGLAFNYASQDIRMYVSTNTLYRSKKDPNSDAHPGWANGAVETFVGSDIKECDECLCYEKLIVSGLPVSGHDHGVNGLLFLANGDLLITVGGATNAGVPSDKLGWTTETPLSSAILIAALSKGSDFDGKVTYDNYTRPEFAKQNGGFDVKIYSSGFRNCFSLTQHTNGQIWATDNGPNRLFGDESTGCDTQRTYSIRGRDEVNLIVRDQYYGHPNRNRGECVFGEGIGPKRTITSAATGIVEYTSNAFSGALQGQLIFSKYAASGDGMTWRASIENGDELSKPLRMSGFSGVVVENGLHGELLMPKVQKGYVSVLKPVYRYPGGAPFVIAVSPNRGKDGHRTFISGEGFEEGLVAKFGGMQASNIRLVDSNGFFCNVPAGSGTVEIDVVVKGISSKGASGQGGTVKYVYVT